MSLKHFFIAMALIAGQANVAVASGLGSLGVFLKTVTSGRADFTQVVTSPAREGQTQRVKTSTGQFVFARPLRFRFDYQKPFAQTIVADGQSLWLYDADLNQVTVRPQSQALAATPAALIALAPDVATLRSDFVLADAPDRDGLEWVMATPRANDSQIQSVQMGFLTSGEATTLKRLQIEDSFGQRSVLSFEAIVVNTTLPAGVFVFKAPPGADVIRQ